MATKKPTTIGHHTTSGGHVSLAREEYEAFLSREESYQQLLVDREKTRGINADLAHTVDAQARRLAGSQQKISNLERISSLQDSFIHQLRDGTKTASMEDLSEFFRLWQIHTGKSLDARKITSGLMEKYEPDIFRSWRNWVNDAGKKDRTFNEAGSRQGGDQPNSAKEMQEHIIVRLRQDNAALASKIQHLESELGPLMIKDAKP